MFVNQLMVFLAIGHRPGMPQRCLELGSRYDSCLLGKFAFYAEVPESVFSAMNEPGPKTSQEQHGATVCRHAKTKRHTQKDPQQN